MTPTGIEPATFRFVTQNLNHCATVVPLLHLVQGVKKTDGRVDALQGKWAPILGAGGRLRVAFCH